MPMPPISELKNCSKIFCAWSPVKEYLLTQHQLSLLTTPQICRRAVAEEQLRYVPWLAAAVGEVRGRAHAWHAGHASRAWPWRWPSRTSL